LGCLGRQQEASCGDGCGMARAIWSGAISFGLVNIPVKVVTAVREKGIHFHLLHEKDASRIKFKRFCAKEDREVDGKDIVRGYEVSRGKYVTFTDEELEAADPKAARTIEISEFVALAEIDPAFYDRTYFLVPDKNAALAYGLLQAALERTGRVGIARVVMREKEYLVALRTKGKAIAMETMHFADEVVQAKDALKDHEIPAKANEKQLKLAEQLITNLTEPFDPAKHKDTHRQKVLDLIERKRKGHKVEFEPVEAAPTKATDLMAALEGSLSARRVHAPRSKAGGKRPKRTKRSRTASSAAKSKRKTLHH
jgi:DNA end-binding protein Ku